MYRNRKRFYRRDIWDYRIACCSRCFCHSWTTCHRS